MNKHNKMFFSIIIPTYNEENRIKFTLKSIMDYLDNRSYKSEIIVVDDGSRDRTIEVSKNLLKKRFKNYKILSLKKNMGKGYALRKGIFSSEGNIILFTDADLSTPIDEIKKLLNYTGAGYDIAIGSRGLKESDIQLKQSWVREKIGKFFNIMVQLIAIRGIKDTQCGFKCFKRKAAIDIFKKQLINRFAFDVEVLYIARKMGYRIKEVPVIWKNSSPSKVNILRDSTKMFIDLIRIRLNDLIRKYD